jgi:hypothetical protein
MLCDVFANLISLAPDGIFGDSNWVAAITVPGDLPAQSWKLASKHHNYTRTGGKNAVPKYFMQDFRLNPLVLSNLCDTLLFLVKITKNL